MRRRRMLRSKKMYDLCFRSLRGLPLPARALTTLIIESIMGRLLRSEDVIVCGYVWMSNHVHMQVYSLDCTALTHFHERLKKRLTDFLKRLLNISHLSLWDNRTTLGEVLDLEAAPTGAAPPTGAAQLSNQLKAMQKSTLKGWAVPIRGGHLTKSIRKLGRNPRLLFSILFL
jgi:hypothetical protein